MTTITELGAPLVAGQSIQRSSSPSPEQDDAPRPSRLEPLSPGRHRLELTIGADVRAKLERARNLLGHRIPDGSLELVLDRALDELLAKLEKERLGKTARPNRKARSSKVGRISRAVRREVFARDGEQCTFTDEHGNRCPSRTRLELDHIDPRARGGGDDATNLRVVCRAHNGLHAENAFGKEHVERRIHIRQRRSPPPQCNDTFDIARRALTKMGFRDAEARRALSIVNRSDAVTAPLPIPEHLRAALRVLAT
jgi:5-methylcytosine-specific restriction endonuclease McrA